MALSELFQSEFGLRRESYNEQTTRGRALGQAMQAPQSLEFLPTLTMGTFKCTEQSSREPEALCHLDNLWCNDLDVMQG